MSEHLLESERHSPFRARLVAGVLAAGFCAVGVKGGLVALSGTDSMAAMHQTRGQDGVISKRADILDRNGERLATSIPVYSMWADPGEVWDPGVTADELAAVFPDLDRDTLVRRLSNEDLDFVWLKREMTPVQRQTVFELSLEGVYFREESRRFYPQKTLGAHAIGFTDVDGVGIAGIEHSLNDRLSSSMEPVYLTIDLSVQYSLEEELAAAALDSNAIGGAGIVIDARSGEILAMASWPTYDPNRRQDVTQDQLLDRTVGGVYELGSVFKPLTMAAGLDHGVVGLRETFDVRQPITIGADTINDDHPLPRGSHATPTMIIAHSSNIGTVQIAQRIGPEKHRRFLETLGLMEAAPVELSGTAAPLLPAYWSPITEATVSFGHGMSVSPLAFAAAFSSFANDGTYNAPTLLLERDPLEEVREPRRVMSTPTSQVVVQMMRATVTDGTGRQADVPGYRVAGKTGTAEKVISGVYDKDKNITSFAAVFPADDPKYVVMIVLDEPKAQNGRAESAAFNAAPAVGRVIERIAPILDVMPYFEDIDPAALRVRTVSDRRSL